MSPIMKRPQEEIGSSRKSLPARSTRKAAKPAALKQPTQRKRILKKDSDAELVKIFGQK